MERASSNINQFWLDPSKILTSTAKIYPSPTDSVPIWQQEIGKFLESEILNNSESTAKSDSAVNGLEVSSDSHEGKFQVALQRFLDFTTSAIFINFGYLHIKIADVQRKICFQPSRFGDFKI